MPDLLDPAAPPNDPTWAACLAHVGPTTLLAFDYDGTLAPIVPNVREAWMPEATRTAMQALLGLAGGRTAVLSGREADDVRAYFAPLAPLAPAFVVGNHGADALDPEAVAPRLAAWRPILQRAAAQVSGSEVEEKSLGFSVHWRRATDPAAAERAFRDAAKLLQDATIIGGHLVLNVLPREAPHKGDALVTLAEESGCDRILFVGDDETDELAFAHPYPMAFVGVRVGASHGTRATYWIREQAGVNALLFRLRDVLRELAPAASVTHP